MDVIRWWIDNTATGLPSPSFELPRYIVRRTMYIHLIVGTSCRDGKTFDAMPINGPMIRQQWMIMTIARNLLSGEWSGKVAKLRRTCTEYSSITPYSVGMTKSTSKRSSWDGPLAQVTLRSKIGAGVPRSRQAQVLLERNELAPRSVLDGLVFRSGAHHPGVPAIGEMPNTAPRRRLNGGKEQEKSSRPSPRSTSKVTMWY